MSKKIIISVILVLSMIGISIYLYNKECNDNRSFVILRGITQYADSHMIGSEKYIVKDLCRLENNLLIVN